MREAGTTSLFQMPPRDRAASGAGTEPSPCSAKVPAPEALVTASPACSSPDTIQGALPATSSAASVRTRPASRTRANARRATAVASPALALRLPSGTSHHSRSGSRPVVRHVRAASMTQGSTAYPTSTGQCPMTSRSATNGFQTYAVTATSWATSDRSVNRTTPAPATTSTPSSTSFWSSIPGTISSSTATTASDGTALGSPLPSPRNDDRRLRSGTQTMS